MLLVALVALCLIFAAVAQAGGDSFYLRLAAEALIFAGPALSVDILLGFTGMLSLGQALYFGLGAYVSTLVLKTTPSFWMAMAAVAAVALVVGVIGGVVANRVRGVYFALITFGLAEVAAKAVYNTPMLGASDGLIGVPVVQIPLGPFAVSTGSPVGFFLFTLGFLVVLYVLVAYLFATPFGRLLIALKVNEARVPALGYRPVRARMVSYVVAALVAALSGALYPLLRGFVSPELMSFTTSGDALVTVVIGGAGTLVGALYGSLLLTLMRSIIGSWTPHHLMVVGVLFMAVVIFFPKGLIGFVRPYVERLLGAPR